MLLVLSVISSAKTLSLARIVFGDAGHRLIEAWNRAQAHSLLSNGLDPALVLCEFSSRDEFGSQRFDDIPHSAMARNFCLITKPGGGDGLRCAANRLEVGGVWHRQQQ